MNVNVRKVFALALVLVALASIFVPAASAGARQLWYIYPDSPDGILSTTAPVGYGTQVLEKDGDTLYWCGAPVECPLSMGKGTWTLHLDYSTSATGGSCDIKVWLWSPTSPHAVIASSLGESFPGTGTTKDVDMIGAENVDFGVDDELLFAIYGWDSTTDLTINTGDGKSTLRGPASDPGYPVPELSSLALFSVGLLALVGYVGYRRRRI